MAASMAIPGAGFVLCDAGNDNSVNLLFVRNLPFVGMCGFFFAYAVGFNSVLLIFLAEIYSPGTMFMYSCGMLFRSDRSEAFK